MKPKNNIDNFFKDKLKHRAFELKDSFIADLEQKLDERKKKRRGIFFLFFLFMGLLPFGYYIVNFNNDEVLEKVVSSNIEQETTLETNSIPKKEHVFIQKEKKELLDVVPINKGGDTLESKDKTTSLKSNDDEKELVSSSVIVNKITPKGVRRHGGINGNANVTNYRLMNKEGRNVNHQTDTNNFQLEPTLVNNKEPKKESYRKLAKRESEEQVEELKQGILLVRLKTSNNKINALKKLGKIEKSLEVKEEQDLENKKIISAFKQHFTFCDVVFFHSNYSDEVRAKKLSNIFLNDSLEIDGSIKVDTNRAIYIAEFTDIGQGPSKLYSYYDDDPNENDSLTNANDYNGQSNFSFYALVIKSDEFIQLRKPFPYYARASYKAMKQHPEQAIFLAPTLPFQNHSVDDTVKDMNEKLHDYFNKVK